MQHDSTQHHKQHQSIRLFENELLERLSHVHPLTPLLMWGPIAGWLLWRSFSLYQLPGRLTIKSVRVAILQQHLQLSRIEHDQCCRGLGPMSESTFG